MSAPRHAGILDSNAWTQLFPDKAPQDRQGGGGRDQRWPASWAGGWASALDGGRGVTTSVPCWETVQAFAMTPKAADEEFSKGSEPCCPSWAPHA